MQLRRLPGFWEAALVLPLMMLQPQAVAATPAGSASPSTAIPLDLERLSAMEGVDPKDIADLRKAGAAEASKALALASGLSRPSSAQMISAFFLIDGAPAEYKRTAKWAAAFAERPKDGAAGIVRVAALAVNARQELMPPLFTVPFEPGEHGFTWPATPDVPRRRLEQIRFDLDAEPASILIDLVRQPRTVEEVRRVSRHPVFEAMYQHRSQSFYPVPITEEKWTVALQQASLDEPVHRLYAFVRPDGFFHLNNVKAEWEKYDAFLATLAESDEHLEEHVRRVIAHYVPDGTRVDRKVYLSFGKGADGWGARDVLAMDLEYYREGFAHFIGTLTHESFHGAQDEIATQFPLPPPRRTLSPAEGKFLEALGTVFREGVATYVAPAGAVSAEERAARRARAVPLMGALLTGLQAGDPEAVEKALNDGTAGGGPFYWYGAAMSADIVQAFGLPRFRQVLKCGAVCFFETHQQALGKLKRPAWLSRPFVDAVKSVR